MGTRKSLNGRKSKERREEPLGTMSYQTRSKRSPPFWLLIGARKTQAFWHQSEARTAVTVWTWSGKTLSPGALLAVLYFSARLDFSSSPLSAPGSPRMVEGGTVSHYYIVVIRKFIDFMSLFRHSVWFSFSVFKNNFLLQSWEYTVQHIAPY